MCINERLKTVNNIVMPISVYYENNIVALMIVSVYQSLIFNFQSVLKPSQLARNFLKHSSVNCHIKNILHCTVTRQEIEKFLT